jgi:N-methylhydantoinase A
VTDADLVLGLIDPVDFAGGSITLRPDLARTALRTDIGDGLGLSADMAAYAVYEMVCENMASAARAHTVERGVSASQHTMIAFGGAAPLHVARVAEKIGVSRVIVPPNAGVGSAIGFLAAPVSYEMVRTSYMRLGQFDHAVAASLLADMARDIRGWVEPAAHGAALFERRVAYMRYIGQGHEISVELPLRDLTPADDLVLRAQFEQSYKVLFKRVIPNAAIEIMAWSVMMTTATDFPDPIARPAPSAAPEASGTITVFDGRSGEMVTVPRYRREQLHPGARFPGPALIAEDETSTFVTDGFDVWIDGLGSIVMDRKLAS